VKPRPSRRRPARRAGPPLEDADLSLLDLVDNVLNRGVVVDGEVVFALAGVDLVYLRLSAILCAADRLFAAGPRR
jgi:gas vesicle structural protein